MKNLYLSTAEFYDIDNYHLWYHDVGFYLEYARRQQGPILEIACGTGRVTIPLAQAGFEVQGIDLSLPMLSIFRRKLDRLDDETAGRIRLEQADMADFELGRTFDLIVVPFRAFQALTTDERARRALLCINATSRNGGFSSSTCSSPHGAWTAPGRARRSGSIG